MHRVTAACSHQADGMEGPADTVAPKPDPAVLLNTVAVNLKVCRELLKEAQASLGCVEAQRGPGYRVRSVLGPASQAAAGQALGPPSACYSLFRCLPEDCEWAQLLERQLRTRTFELLPPEQLVAALSFLTEEPTEGPIEGHMEECTHYQSAESPQYQSEGPREETTEESTHYQSAEGSQDQSEGPVEGPTLYKSPEDPQDQSEWPAEWPSLYQSAEGPSLYQSAEGPTVGPTSCQSAEGPTEGPSLYQSALDLSSDHTQELPLRGVVEEDLGDSRGTRDGGDSSDEGPPSPPQPSLGLLEVGELSSISHSPPPHPHKMLSVLFKRHLAPCNSTPRNTGVQPIFESRPLVCGPHASQSFCTAVDEPVDHSFRISSCDPVGRGAAGEQTEPEGDVCVDTKRTREAPLFESEGTAEGDAQGTAEGDAQGTAEGDAQGTAEGDAQGESEEESEGTAEGDAQGTAEGDAQGESEEESKGTAEGDAQGTAEGDAQGESEEESEGTAERDAQGTAEGDAQGESEEESEGTAEGDAQGESEDESEGTAERQIRTAEGLSEEAEGSPEGASEVEVTSEVESEGMAEGEAHPRDTGLAPDHQPHPGHIRILFTPVSVQDSAGEKISADLSAVLQDSAALCKVGSISESGEELASGESLHSTPDRPTRHDYHDDQYEPQWASLLSYSYRAHSTLDDVLQHLQN